MKGSILPNPNTNQFLGNLLRIDNALISSWLEIDRSAALTPRLENSCIISGSSLVSVDKGIRTMNLDGSNLS